MLIFKCFVTLAFYVAALQPNPFAVAQPASPPRDPSNQQPLADQTSNPYSAEVAYPSTSTTY